MADEKQTTTETTEQPTLTVEEQIAKAIEETNASWQDKFQAEVNKASKAEREKYEKKLQQATLTEAERLQAEREEEFKKLSEELSELKAEKSKLVRTQKLNDAKLPQHYLYDVRLLEATDDQIDTVVKTLSKEYGDFVKDLTKGQVSGTAPKVPEVQTNELVSQLEKRYPYLAGKLPK